MKKHRFLIIFSVLLAGGIILMYACKKSKLNKDTSTSSDQSVAENLFDDIYQAVNETASNEDDGSKGITEYTFGTCASVTTTPAWPDTTFPKTTVIDFGTDYCTGTDGRQRKGKITYTISGRYRIQGTTISVTLDNFYIDDYKVEGTKTISNGGRNSANNLTYSVGVQNAKITTPDNEEFTWESTRNREWIEGEDTGWFTDNGSGGVLGLDGILDDVYAITGNASGINRRGRNFTVTITTALRVQLNCRYITSGVMEIVPDELKTRVVDYGDGTCDDKATVTVGNREYEITLRSSAPL